MFTSGPDPLASLDQTLLQKVPFYNDINISSPLPSFGNFQPYEENYAHPFAFLQELLENQQEHHAALQNDGVLAANDHVLVDKMVEKSENRNGNGVLENNQRNKSRSCKKDRHSKIDTASGPRDRRMRLSMEVARKFFSLQDMLKFDKASKTVEWLLTKSKSAIEEVEAAQGHIILKNSSSSIIINNNNENDGDDDDENDKNNNSNSSVLRSTTASSTTSEFEVVSRNKMKKKKEKGSTTSNSTRKRRSHTSSSRSIIAKESREKARERAKQRTREKFRSKMMMLMKTTMSRTNIEDSHAEICEDSGTQLGQDCNNNTRNPNSLKMGCEDQLRTNQDMGGRDDSVSGKWTSGPAYSSFDCVSSEQNGQFNEFPLFSKSWDGNNDQFLC